MDLQIEGIAEMARASIGQFCISVCKAQCCRRGFLTVKDDEIQTVTKGKALPHRFQPLHFGVSLLDLRKEPCPALTSDFRCSVYADKKRPKPCANYPLYVHGKQVIAAPDCLAVQQGLLDPFLKQLEDKGCKLI